MPDMIPSNPDPKFACPVRPFRGIRAVDVHGAGGYGAPRGQRVHFGPDYLADPGDEVVAMFSGEIKRISLAYPNTDLGLVLVRSNDMGWYAEYLYILTAGLKVGMPVKASEPFARAADVATYYKNLHPEKGPMANHIHVTLYRATDPSGIVFFPPTKK